MTARRAPPERGTPLAQQQAQGCVSDETTWRADINEYINGDCRLLKRENGCCVLQYDRDMQLLEMFKHFIEHPHRQMSPRFENWLRNLDGLGSVSRATVSMSNRDFLLVPDLVQSLRSSGTSIDVLVDHTVQGDVMPFKFTNLFLGETRYIGRVGRSDPSQSVRRVVMDVVEFGPLISHSEYDALPEGVQGVNPPLIVSFINITPIVPLRLSVPLGWRGRRGWFLEQVTLFTLFAGLPTSPSSFKFELGKEFQNYFEYIPHGYERLLPESFEQARALAYDLQQSKDQHEGHETIRSIAVNTSENSVGLVYDIFCTYNQDCAFLIKVSLWPLVVLETSV